MWLGSVIAAADDELSDKQLDSRELVSDGMTCPLQAEEPAPEEQELSLTSSWTGVNSVTTSIAVSIAARASVAWNMFFASFHFPNGAAGDASGDSISIKVLVFLRPVCFGNQSTTTEKPGVVGPAQAIVV